MPPPGADERLHFDAIAALLTTALDGHLYDEGMVPGVKSGKGGGRVPQEFTVLSIERDPALLTRTSGRAHQSAWAATLESASARYAHNVRGAQSTIANALEGVRLVIDDRESTPIEFESAVSVRWSSDAAMFVGRWTCTYVL